MRARSRGDRSETAPRRAHGERFTLGGDKLARPPRGFDKDHPLVEDLKRKSFMASTKLSRAQVTGGKLPRELAAASKTGAPLVKFLCGALDVPF
jgi:uncharacterized protein (DUF2461 family)